MARLRVVCGLFACALILTAPRTCNSQTLSQAPNISAASLHALMGSTQLTEGRWEVTLDGRVGFPIGTLQSVDRPIRGTRFSLSNLGINLSEAIEASVAFSFTPRDALRVGGVYYFLRGSSTHSGTVDFNAAVFRPGSLDTNADFYRLSLAYERTLLSSADNERLIGSLGLTYVPVSPTLSGSFPTFRGPGHSSTETFSAITYRHVWPVPLLGLRWDHPLGHNLTLRTSFLGGALPRVDTLRAEEAGHDVYFEQANIDVGAGLAYSIWRKVQIEGRLSFHVLSPTRDEPRRRQSV